MPKRNKPDPKFGDAFEAGRSAARQEAARKPDRAFCPVCGLGAKIDEDGLCVHCGATCCPESKLRRTVRRKRTPRPPALPLGEWDQSQVAFFEAGIKEGIEKEQKRVGRGAMTQLLAYAAGEEAERKRCVAALHAFLKRNGWVGPKALSRKILAEPKKVRKS